MSGVPKRSHEDAVHQSSKHPHQDSGAYSKLMPSVSNDHHIPYDMSQDSRVAKTVRTEPRDADRRSPLHTVYRMPSSSNDSHADHPIGPENRIESRDFKESRDPRFENRDTKTEKKELHGEARRDSQIAKSEKDVRVDGREDDNKDIRYERDSHNDSKGDIKTDKDGYGMVSSSSHLSWKESKEYRGKRFSDAPGGSLDSWHTSRGNTPTEVGKDSSMAEERDYLETHEAVGENKIDSKSEDRFKERKRKDVKHRDWGDREKERSDRRSSTPVNNNSGDNKESAKEDRDVEKWEKERKDLPKEKESSKEKEKDNSKRESLNGMEKDGLNDGKELGDGSAKNTEQENLLKQKDVDGWKNVDGEVRERRKERDADLEGDRPDKRCKIDKQSEDGSAHGEGTGEKEREVHNYNVQHRKRIHRSRGSPQVANREARFRSHTQAPDNEESQGKAEVSSVVYKVGESMQELIKLWKAYELSQSQVDKNSESSNSGPTLEIRIPAENVTATNRQVRGGQLWGTDVYTYDSDLVAVLMHTGYCRPTASPPPMAVQELRTTIRVLPPQDCYISTLRNNVRSRAWGAAIGCSYKVERCCIVKKGGGTIDLEPCLTHTSTVEPTLAPVAIERTITTRAAASNALRQQRFVREVTIQYNLCNEPWIKYSISIVADKGLKKPLYTSARLKKGEVLYLETHSYMSSVLLERRW
ncbi:hypothetical protein AAZX31_16G184400 [Glycine max]